MSLEYAMHRLPLKVGEQHPMASASDCASLPLQRPRRPCLYCPGKLYTTLCRHLRKKHSEEPDVKRAMNTPDLRDRSILFGQIRNQGILNYNIKYSNGGTESLILTERRGGGKGFVVCNNCHRFLLKTSRKKHEELCVRQRKVLLDSNLSFSEFRQAFCNPGTKYAEKIKLLFNQLRSDPTGDFCRGSQVLKLLTFRFLLESKNPKNKEFYTNKFIRQFIRCLAKFIMEFIRLVSLSYPENEAVSEVSIFNIQFWDFFITALDNVTCSVKDGKEIVKHAVKLNLRSGLQKLTQTFHSTCLLKSKANKDSSYWQNMYVQIGEFECIYKDNVTVLFSSSSLILRREKLFQNRLKDREEIEEAVLTMNQFLTKEINRYIETCTSQGQEKVVVNKSEYIALRRVISTYIFLFNASRGAEVSRITLEEYREGRDRKIPELLLKRLEAKLSDATLTADKIDQITSGINALEKYFLIYIIGKGIQYVDILINKQFILLLDVLADKEVRRKAGVLSSNMFLFPSIGRTDAFSSGYSDLTNLLKGVGVKRFSADDVRHRAADKNFESDRPDFIKKLFCEHSGHSRRIEESVYRSAQTMNRIMHNGCYLEDIFMFAGTLGDELKDNFTIGRNMRSDGSQVTTTRMVFPQIYEDQLVENPDINSGNGNQNKDFPKETGNAEGLGVSDISDDISGSEDSDCEALGEEDLSDEYSSGNSASSSAACMKILKTVNRKVLRKRSGPNYHWTEDDNKVILDNFTKTIEDLTNEGVKGPLPSISVLTEFMENFPNIMKSVPKSAKIGKLKLKLVNERKRFRENYDAQMSKYK